MQSSLALGMEEIEVEVASLSQQDQLSPAPSAGQTRSTPSAPAAPVAAAPTSPPPASRGTLSRLALPLFAVPVAFGFVAPAPLRWDGFAVAARLPTTEQTYTK